MINISDSAKEKILDTLIESKSKYLRLGLRGGGCNGFEYFFALETEKDETDVALEVGHDFAVLVDCFSIEYLEECELDYRKDLFGESFVFNNPSVATKCGCGNSIGF